MHRSRPTLPWLATVLLMVSVSTPAVADVKGRAYAVYANLPDHGISATTECDIGALAPRPDGSRSSTRDDVSYGDVLRVDHMESESHGDPCTGHSGSKLEAGWIMKGSPYEVTWRQVESAHDHGCCKQSHHDEVSARFVGLTFAGAPVHVTGRPNQVLTIPGVATLILNERGSESDADCDDANVEHHALHLILHNRDEVILGATKFDRDGCCLSTPTRSTTWGTLKLYYR